MSEANADNPAPTVEFFVAVLKVLNRQNRDRACGKGDQLERIRAHLGHVEALYRSLPSETPPTIDKPR